MPSASEELRQIMRQRFGNIDDSGPAGHLCSKGYTMSYAFTWSHPTIKDVKEMDQFDYECLIFLADEWDFGGLEERGTDA